jgi:hypothetical protein
MYAALMDARLTTQVAMARATGRDLAMYTGRYRQLSALLNEVDRAEGDKVPLHKAVPTLRRRAGKSKPPAPRVADAESSKDIRTAHVVLGDEIVVNGETFVRKAKEEAS